MEGKKTKQQGGKGQGAKPEFRFEEGPNRMFTRDVVPVSPPPPFCALALMKPTRPTDWL